MAAPCAFKGRFGLLNVAHLPFTSLVWLFRPNAQRESPPGRTEGVPKIAKRFGVDPGTVQRISRPFDGVSVAA
jgi:hypothetical protein